MIKKIRNLIFRKCKSKPVPKPDSEQVEQIFEERKEQDV